MSSIQKTILAYIFLFTVLALFALNFNFIEGDDARTILYHVMGRDADFQPPYSEYHSMFDAVLSYLPSTRETVLRYTGIGLSFFAGLVVFILLVLLLDKKLPATLPRWTFVLIPVIVPETLFTTLLLNPTNVSIACLLGAHLMLLQYQKNKSIWTVLGSVVLFGLGVGFRWVNVFYLSVLFVEYAMPLFLFRKPLALLQEIKKLTILFVAYVMSFVIWIYISGYSITDMIATYVSGTTYIDEKETSYLAMFSESSAYLTPIAVVCFLVGLIAFVRQKNYQPLALLVFALLPYSILGFFPVYKYMIVTIVPFTLMVVTGFNVLNKAAKGFAFLILLIPWFVGIQIESDSSWGPGFEVRSKKTTPTKLENFNPDKSYTLGKIKPKFASGTALPTSEGPRPLYGYAYVLGYEWSRFLDRFSAERYDAVALASSNKLPIIQDVNHSFVSSKLIELGFSTHEPFENFVDKVNSRAFVKEKDTLRIHVFDNKNKLTEASHIQSFLSKHQYAKVVVFSSYSNIITKMNVLYGKRFEIKGAYWGVLTQRESKEFIGEK